MYLRNQIKLGSRESNRVYEHNNNSRNIFYHKCFCICINTLHNRANFFIEKEDGFQGKFNYRQEEYVIKKKMKLFKSGSRLRNKMKY